MIKTNKTKRDRPNLPGKPESVAVGTMCRTTTWSRVIGGIEPPPTIAGIHPPGGDTWYKHRRAVASVVAPSVKHSSLLCSIGWSLVGNLTDII